MIRRWVGLGLIAMAIPQVAAAAPIRTVAYFSGHSDIILPDGRQVGESKEWVCRTVDEAGAEITEQVITVDDKGSAKEFVVRFRVTPDGTFTLSEAHQAFKGAGILVGTPWHWDRWHSISLLPHGETVESRDQMQGDTLSVVKRLADAQGKLKATLQETLEPTTAAEFNENRRRLIASP